MNTEILEILDYKRLRLKDAELLIGPAHYPDLLECLNKRLYGSNIFDGVNGREITNYFNLKISRVYSKHFQADTLHLLGWEDCTPEIKLFHGVGPNYEWGQPLVSLQALVDAGKTKAKDNYWVQRTLQELSNHRGRLAPYHQGLTEEMTANNYLRDHGQFISVSQKFLEAANYARLMKTNTVACIEIPITANYLCAMNGTGHLFAHGPIHPKWIKKLVHVESPQADELLERDKGVVPYDPAKQREIMDCVLRGDQKCQSTRSH